MRFALRLTLLLVGATLLGAAVTGLAKPLLDSFHPGAGTYDLAPSFRRISEAFAVAGGVLLWMRDGRRLPRRAPGRSRGAWMLGGFLFGFCSFALLVAARIGVNDLRFELVPWRAWPAVLVSALLTGLAVGLVEETIFRGWMMRELVREQRVAAAVVATSLLYASLHFYKASVLVSHGPAPGIGWLALGEHLKALANPAYIAPLVGLALAGAVLAMVRLTTGSLACAIGWHAGWVFVFKSAKLYVEPNPGRGWLFGPDGVAGQAGVWCALLAILLVLSFPRIRAGLRNAEAERT